MPTLKELEDIKDNLKNELIEINELQRQHKYIYSAGYSPKCSICNHNKIFEIEEMREKNYTLEEIKDKLGLEVVLWPYHVILKTIHLKGQPINSNKSF